MVALRCAYLDSILVCDLEFKDMDSGSTLLAIRLNDKERQDNVLLTAFVKVCMVAALEAYHPSILY